MSDSATINALTTALGSPPKPQMRRIAFPTESAQGDTPLGTLERLVNLYAEPMPAEGRSAVALRPTPGLAVAYPSAGSGPIRAMSDDMPGFIYYVQGRQVFRLSGGNPPVSIGSMASAGLFTNMVTIAAGPLHTVIVDPPTAFGIKHSDGVIHQILGTVDSPFSGATSVAYVDGYFVFTAAQGDDSKFFSAKLLDPDNFDAFDFAFADAVPNVIRRVVSHQDRLWIFGDRAIEVWVVTGDADFPLRRDSGGMIEFGTADPRSIAKCDGSLFFVERNGMVLRTNGYRCDRVSTHPIERRIHAYGAERITGMGHAEQGHQLYTLRLEKNVDPGMSLVYDAATKRWHDRSSSADGAGPWNPMYAAFDIVTQRWMMGAATGGALLTPTTGLATDAMDDVAPPKVLGRIAVLPPLWNATRRMFFNRIEVEIEPSSASTLLLDYTDDGGASWAPARDLPTSGARAVATRLGSAYHRTYRLRATGNPVLYGVEELAQGADL